MICMPFVKVDMPVCSLINWTLYRFVLYYFFATASSLICIEYNATKIHRNVPQSNTLFLK